MHVNPMNYLKEYLLSLFSIILILNQVKKAWFMIMHVNFTVLKYLQGFLKSCTINVPCLKA